MKQTMKVNLQIMRTQQNSKRQEFLSLLSSGKNVIIFSPHLDDAVLSMGSLIHNLQKIGKSITVTSIFTEGSHISSVLTKKLLRQAGYTHSRDYFATRREEDIAALKILGVTKVQHLNHIDGAWRSDKKSKVLYPNTTLNIMHPEDKKLIDTLKSEFVDFQTDTIVFAPLGRGKHVDHMIIRETCSQVFSSVIYYSDFPYSSHHPNESDFISFHQLQEYEGDDTRNIKKVDAILTYKTQLKALFSDNVIRLSKEMFYTNLK